MIRLDLSQDEVRIDPAPASKVPVVILGCGPCLPWVPALYKVVREPTRRWRLSSSFAPSSPTDLIRLSDGFFEARSFPEAKRGNARVVDFRVTKIGDWDGLSVEVVRVSEPLALFGFGLRASIGPESSPFLLTVHGVDDRNLSVEWSGAGLPSTRLERLFGVEAGMPDPEDFDDSIGFDDPINPLAVAFRKGPLMSPRLRTPEELDEEFPRHRRDLVCPDCGGMLVLKDGKYGVFYGCENWNSTGCKGAHNCHKMTAEPLGIPANAETRALRKRAHEAFDQLWKQMSQDERDERAGKPRMGREQAYDWLSKEMAMKVQETHIARFSKEQCLEVLRIVKRFTGQNTRFDRILDDD